MTEQPVTIVRCSNCNAAEYEEWATTCDDGQIVCNSCANELFGVRLKVLSDNTPDPNEYGSWEELMADESKVETIRLVREALNPPKPKNTGGL